MTEYKGYEKFAKKSLYCIYGNILVQNKGLYKFDYPKNILPDKKSILMKKELFS